MTFSNWYRTNIDLGSGQSVCGCVWVSSVTWLCATHSLAVDNPPDGVCVSLRVLCPRMSARAHCFVYVVVFFFPPFLFFFPIFGGAMRCKFGSAGPASLVCACAYTRVCPVCVRVYVIPGEPVAGQCVSPHQGFSGGGDADDRQPLRFGLPPLLLPSAPLQRLQGPPIRGTHTITITLTLPPHPPYPTPVSARSRRGRGRDPDLVPRGRNGIVCAKTCRTKLTRNGIKCWEEINAPVAGGGNGKY